MTRRAETASVKEIVVKLNNVCRPNLNRGDRFLPDRAPVARRIDRNGPFDGYKRLGCPKSNGTLLCRSPRRVTSETNDPVPEHAASGSIIKTCIGHGHVLFSGPSRDHRITDGGITLSFTGNRDAELLAAWWTLFVLHGHRGLEVARWQAECRRKGRIGLLIAPSPRSPRATGADRRAPLDGSVITVSHGPVQVTSLCALKTALGWTQELLLFEVSLKRLRSRWPLQRHARPPQEKKTGMRRAAVQGGEAEFLRVGRSRFETGESRSLGPVQGLHSRSLYEHLLSHRDCRDAECPRCLYVYYGREASAAARQNGPRDPEPTGWLMPASFEQARTASRHALMPRKGLTVLVARALSSHRSAPRNRRDCRVRAMRIDRIPVNRRGFLMTKKAVELLTGRGGVWLPGEHPLRWLMEVQKTAQLFHGIARIDRLGRRPGTSQPFRDAKERVVGRAPVPKVLLKPERRIRPSVSEGEPSLEQIAQPADE